MADLVTVDELKSYLRIPVDEEDTTDDAELQLAVSAASSAIQQIANRSFEVAGESATPRVFTATRHGGRYEIVVDDFQDDTGLEVASDPLEDESFSEAVTAYSLRPFNVGDSAYNLIALDRGYSVPLHAGAIEVTAKWGWTEVPNAVKLATLIQAARFFKRRDAPFGISGSPEVQGEMRLLAKIDPDVEVAIRPFKRIWGAV